MSSRASCRRGGRLRCGCTARACPGPIKGLCGRAFQYDAIDLFQLSQPLGHRKTQGALFAMLCDVEALLQAAALLGRRRGQIGVATKTALPSCLLRNTPGNPEELFLRSFWLNTRLGNGSAVRSTSSRKARAARKARSALPYLRSGKVFLARRPQNQRSMRLRCLYEPAAAVPCGPSRVQSEYPHARLASAPVGYGVPPRSEHSRRDITAGCGPFGPG